MKFDFNKYTKDYIDSDIIKQYALKVATIKKKFETDISELEWFNMSKYVDNSELKDMLDIASNLKENTDVLLVIGIGGSYMGAKAMISALTPYFKKNPIEIIFVGTSLSSSYYHDLLNYLKDKRISINVISKSGNTMETIINYDLIMKMMHKRYSKKELRKRIFITTNIHNGKLLEIAKSNGYRTFFIPDNIGGRYSVLTPVTLFPMAVAGFDIVKFLKGAKEGRLHINHASIYAMVRTILKDRERIVEAYTVYEPKLEYFTEWLKQLFAETEGKECQGILPISVINPRDLHALGQFIQEGNPILFETVINVEHTDEVIIDKYNEKLSDINNVVLDAVCKAHFEAGSPTNIITMDAINEYSLGEACMFFMMSAVISAYLIDVDPFNQPGVEKYKEIIAKNLRVLK